MDEEDLAELRNLIALRDSLLNVRNALPGECCLKIWSGNGRLQVALCSKRTRKQFSTRKLGEGIVDCLNRLVRESVVHRDLARL